MAWLLLPLGVIVLLGTIVDLFATVAQPGRHGGFLATRLVDQIWRVALATHRWRPSHRRLAAAGVACVAAVPVCWMAGMWIGWSLIFSSSESAVLDARTGDRASTTSRVYYAGYSLFTSGLGDKVPGSGGSEIATVLATAMGLGLVTLAITYLVPVVQSATARRSVARLISRLGATPQGIVDRCWRPPTVTVLTDAATDLLPRLQLLTEQHLTYPVLHYLHSVDVATAFAPRVVALHQAMVLAVDESVSDDARTRFELVREAVEDFADTFPVGDDGDLSDAREQGDDRRRLGELVRRDGWDWSAVDHPGG